MVEEWWSFGQKRYCVWVTYFKKRSLCKYTRVAKRQDRLEVKSMTDKIDWK